MVTIFNKSNRPIGIAGQCILPDRELKVKDKDAFCSVFDEDGNDTGERMIVPGLKALECKGMVILTIQEDKSAEKKAKVEASAEENVEEAPKKRTTRSRTTKKAAE